MSTNSTAHDLVKYDPKASKAFTGQRLSKITYKTDKETKVKPDSYCVSVPVVSSISNDDSALLRPYICQWIMDMQDAVIRQLHEAGSKVVTDSDICAEALAAYLATEAAGNRLTKEFLLAWFAEELAEILMVSIADKLQIGDTPTEAQAKKVEQMLAAYRDSFAALAGGKTAFTPDKAGKMLKVLGLAQDQENPTTTKVKAKLEHMTVVAELEDLGL